MMQPKSQSRPDSANLISGLQLIAYDRLEKSESPTGEVEKLCKELSLFVTSDESDANLFAKALTGDDEAFQKIEADNEDDILIDTPKQIDFSKEYNLSSPVIGRMIAIVVARQLKIDSDDFDSPSPPAPTAEPEPTGWRWRPE